MSMTDDLELRAVLAQCYLETDKFAKTIFPERFTRNFPLVTKPIFDAIDDNNIKQVLITAFRGFGKTSILNMAYPAKHILFRDKKFIVPISCTATQAVLHGENLKHKLMSSSRVRKFFGNVKTDIFAKDMWKGLDTLVLPRGAGQQVRGFISEDYRPDLFIVDDLEDREGVKNPDRRKDLKEWFHSDVVNAVDRSSKDWKIIVIGTILHEDALLSNLREDPDWYKIDLPLCTDTYATMHPDFMNNDAVKDLAESYARRGELHIFYMEYMNSVIPADAPFQQCFFKYYEEDGTMTYDKDVDNVVIFDPAKTTNMSSDYSAIVGIGVNVLKHEHRLRAYSPHQRAPGIYIRDIVNERLHPDDAFEQVYQMCRRLGSRIVGVEITGLEEYIQYPIKNYFAKKDFMPEFIWLKSPGGTKNFDGKERRIKGLVPFYRQGQVYHNKTACGPLESQLLAFPRSKKFDVMDATAYVIEMLDLGERYLGPEQEQATTKYADSYLEEELYDVVEQDLWRII